MRGCRRAHQSSAGAPRSHRRTPPPLRRHRISLQIQSRLAHARRGRRAKEDESGMKSPQLNFFGVCTTAVATACSLAEPAWADEPLFGNVYTTDLLPANGVEVEQWLTWRTGKSVGTF